MGCMSTTKLTIFSYASSLWIHEVTAYYYIQDVGKTSSVLHCTLAAPEIIPSSTNEFSIKLPDYLEIPEKEPVRVGYIRKSHNFLYLGCAMYNQFPNTTIVRRDLGACYNTYKTMYIGVSDLYCYCFRTFENTHVYAQHCLYPCDNPRAALCGGRDHYSVYISVYEHVNVDDNGACSSGECLAMKAGFFSFVWHDCFQPLQGWCTDCLGSVSSKTQQSSWPDFISSCLNNSCRPGNPLLANHYSTGYLWSLVIRRPYILKVIDPWLHIKHSYNGYIMRNGTSFDLFFASGNISMKILCLKDDASTLSIQSSPKRSIQITTEHAPSQINNTKGVNIVTSVLSAKDTHQKPSDMDEESNSAMIAVYVIVPLVLVAMVVGAIYLLRTKRYSFLSFMGKGNNTGPEMQHDNREANGSAINAAFDGNCVPTHPVVIQEPDHAVLDKSNDLDETSLDTSSFDSYFTEDSDYNLPEDQIDNVYENTDGKELTPVDDTYNHFGQEVNNEGTYNTTQRWTNLKDNNNVTENTYDRAGGQQNDNEYNITGTSEIHHEQVDMYSHTLRQ